MKQVLSAVAVALVVQLIVDWWNKQRAMDNELVARVNAGIRTNR
jgi:hypothetical protein